ncbi:MAG: hypothetical protein ACRDH5_13290 [bacterium]
MQKAIVLTGTDIKRLKSLKALNSIAKLVNRLLSGGKRKARRRRAKKSADAPKQAKQPTLKKSKKYPTEAVAAAAS